MTQEAARPSPAGIESPEEPKQRRRWRRWGLLSRLLVLALFLLATVFVAGTWFLHQVFVPRIQEYRPKLERQASAMLGVPVRIGAIVSQGGGWIPSFELHQVQLLNPQGQAALTLPRVVAAVSARSLWWLGFEQIHIDSPMLDVRRDASGRILLAGLTLGDASKAGDQSADWFFSQPEIVLRKGTVQWTDELHQAPPITLTDVDVLIQNPGRQHLFRLDATPSPEWGERFSIQGDFHHALWETQEGDWKNWVGTIHTQFGRVEVAELRKYTQLGVNIQRGKGALRLWVDVRKGDISAMTADVALQDVSVTLSPGLPALELDTLSGRLSGLRDEEAFQVQTQALQFTTHDGVKWPGGNVFASQKRGRLGGEVQGVFRADKLDLSTLTQIANRLPLGELSHRWLGQLAPRGLIDNIEAQWTGSWEAPQTWKATGRLSGIEVHSSLSTNTTTGLASPGRPGIRGAQVDFDVNQSGGQAQLAVSQGSVTLPGVFEEPEVALDQLNASVRWRNKGQWPAADLDVSVDRLQFANADAQGSGSLHWHTAEAGPTNPANRLPGVLELDMALQRADGTKVHRYLPMTIPKATRDYVREAVSKGRSDDVKVRVKGDLRHFPFQNGQGEFRIQAQIKDATYAYVPPRAAKEGTWPALTGLSGLLVFERASMEVKAASSSVQGSKQLQTSKVQALIANLDQPVVLVQGDVRGPLPQMLDVVRQSPLNALTSGALSGATGQGEALTQLHLELPLAKLESSRVQGTLTLANNDLRVTADTPALYKAKGVVTFSDAGFQVTGGQAKFLGGDVKVEGGTIRRPAPLTTAHNEQTILLKAQGQATAQGLRDAKELGLVSQMAKGAAGTLSYTASLGFRRGKPEIVVSSSMQGMALNLPQPLVKAAESAMPLRFEQLLRKETGTAGQALQDLVSLDVGQLVNVDIVRDLSQDAPRVLRGTVAVGLAAGQSLSMPSEGVAASIVFDTIDLDAWDRVFQSASVATTAAATDAPAYWPNVMALRARLLTLGGRQFNRVVVGGTREGQNWRANMDAAELNGYIEFRQSQGNAPGALYARLARLSLGDSTASDIENVLDQQPASIPALDVVVEDLEYKGKKLGRVEVDAVNQGRVGTREWRLRKFNISLPEASLQASGNWARVGEMVSAASAPAASGRNRNAPRRTAMKFKLDIRDSGALLQRFGMGELVRKAPGVMEGQISWLGSPFALDYPSMQGQFNVDIREGQFLKVEPGVARLLGVLSLQALPRRLILDFRDVFSDGFAFDNIRGDVGIENGIAKTNNLQMKGVVAGVLMEGTANIAKETQDLHVVVVPEINAGTASLFAVAVNPVIGLGTFLAQAIIRRPLIKSNTEEFKVEGSWSDPKVTKLSKKDEAAGAPASAASGATTP
jgi:uncharacterized protein (TIGR02099 family)